MQSPEALRLYHVYNIHLRVGDTFESIMLCTVSSHYYFLASQNRKSRHLEIDYGLVYSFLISFLFICSS